jgi:plastocyanin
MSLPRLVAVALGILLLVAACDRSMPSSPSPTPAPDLSSPTDSTAAAPPASAADSAPRVAAAPTKGALQRMVTMLDACDPDTFNEAIGPGTCNRSGGLRFDLFIEQLTKHGAVGAWRFSPDTSTVGTGTTFLATNQGGEVHTFTEVKQFGGGIVADLNVLAHTPDIAPECAALESDDFVAPGGTYRETVHQSGTAKFQCCIHPWMRLEARVTQ